MPRDGSSIYTQPDPDVVADTTIESAKYNNFTNDIAQDLNLPRPIVAGGTGATNAHDAMVNLEGEIADQIVTNYNSFPFVSGSFYSAGGATGAPEPTLSYSGIVVVAAGNPDYISLEASSLDGAARYTRVKSVGVWGAWELQPGSAADVEAAGDARYVNLTGDTMTGQLTVSHNITAAVSSTVGNYYFGTSGTKYLNYDGTNFNLNGGALSASGAVNAAGSVSSGAEVNSVTHVYVRAIGGGNANYHLLDETAASKGVFWWERSSGNIILQNSGNTANNVIIKAATGIVLGQGFMARPGTAGVLGSSTHNFNWTGALAAWVDITNVGNVTLTSDYRTKKDVTELSGMWDTVKALRPIRYTQTDFTPPAQLEANTKSGISGSLFAADSVERWGFIAHELQETLTPSAATGVKDSPDTVQSPNPFTLIAALTKALQEAMMRIETLEAK